MACKRVFRYEKLAQMAWDENPGCVKEELPADYLRAYFAFSVGCHDLAPAAAHYLRL